MHIINSLTHPEMSKHSICDLSNMIFNWIWQNVWIKRIVYFLMISQVIYQQVLTKHFVELGLVYLLALNIITKLVLKGTVQKTLRLIFWHSRLSRLQCLSDLPNVKNCEKLFFFKFSTIELFGLVILQHTKTCAKGALEFFQVHTFACRWDFLNQ